MRISKLAAAAFLGVAALGLSACANTLNTEVSRYQAMPAPQGQTFIVVPGEGMAANGGLEFQRYAGIVAQQLQARGYVPAASPQSASMTVSLGYGVDHGQVRVVDNSFGYGGYGPYGGSFFYPRYGFRSPFYYGWDDPFWYSPFGFGYDDIDTYTVYTSFLDMDIKRASDGQAVFEGTAKARSRTDDLQVLVPNLVEAMFTGFPGNSGEQVRITVPPPPRERR